MKEQFTSGKVSGVARKAYLRVHPSFPRESFKPIRGGYRMTAWESEIMYCRAGGRGYASASGNPVHEYDELPSPAWMAGK
ncbi:hypothetical protein [Mycobacterium phage WXIN]|nr:hypothetical protein [Mycobacterium phage WXIN]